MVSKSVADKNIQLGHANGVVPCLNFQQRGWRCILQNPFVIIAASLLKKDANSEGSRISREPVSSFWWAHRSRTLKRTSKCSELNNEEENGCVSWCYQFACLSLAQYASLSPLRNLLPSCRLRAHWSLGWLC